MRREFIIGAIDLSPYFSSRQEIPVFLFENVPASIVWDLINFSRMVVPLAMPMYVSDAGRTFLLYSIWYDKDSEKEQHMRFNLHTLSGHYFALAVRNKEQR